MEEKSKFQATIADKTILITGGTTGIGRATAHLLAGLGAKVFITGRHQEQLDETIRDAKAQYPDAMLSGITSDLSSGHGIEEVFTALESEFGDIDVLINNAGLAAESAAEGDYGKWGYILDTNLLAYIACANAAIKRMKAKKNGHIVNVGSMSAEIWEPGSSVYVATKSGIQGFTAALRKELNPDEIKITLIEPGAVNTDMQPGTSRERQEKVDAMEMLDAADIAESILFCLTRSKGCDVVSMQVRPLKQLI
ncbi:SDR family oxidoreductase [Sphingobacterium siyangense]|nr:SDR family oxidoreductase [Sphingobacterium siyangense]